MAVLDDMAERLEQVRKREKLSQEAFSQRLGISRGAYQHYVKGGREIPSSVLSALLREFEVDPYWMLRGYDAGASTEKERLLVANAVKITRMLQRAYAERNVAWSDEKLETAVLFAQFYLFDKRAVVEEDESIIANFAAT